MSLFWEDQIVVEYYCKQHFWSHVMSSCALGMHPTLFMTHLDSVATCMACVRLYSQNECMVAHAEIRLISDQYSTPHSKVSRRLLYGDFRHAVAYRALYLQTLQSLRQRELMPNLAFRGLALSFDKAYQNYGRYRALANAMPAILQLSTAVQVQQTH